MLDERNPFLMNICQRPPVVMTRGAGSYLWDHNGRRYLDFVQGWAVNALGHAPEELVRAVTAQSALLLTPSPAFHNAPQLELAQRLVAASGLATAHFACTGAEANEAAVKLARKWARLNRPGAFEVVTTWNAFHGRTFAMMAASGKPAWDALFPPLPAGFRRVPYGDAEAVAAAVDAQTAAIMVEPVQGEGGVVVPAADYLQRLRRVADAAGVLLILDEVQTGMGRTGALFAHQHHGVLPDILTLGKGLGAGVPISAVLASRQASVFAPGDQGGTYNGNPLATAVALEVLRVIERPEFLRNVSERGQELEGILRALGARFGAREVRGRGLLYAMEFAEDVAEGVRDAALELGLLLNAPRPNTLRLMPSLRVTSEELAELRALLSRALERVLRQRAPRGAA
jgi:acetylornithine/N-succinyldiaminopimelate aminotransferase